MAKKDVFKNVAWKLQSMKASEVYADAIGQIAAISIDDTTAACGTAAYAKLCGAVSIASAALRTVGREEEE